MVSDEVADAVAQALTVAPIGQNRPAPTDAGAIDLYLRGRAQLRAFGPEAMERAVKYLEEAHARAPDEPTLLAALARAQARSYFFRTDPAWIEQVLALAERAVAAAPEHGDALLALAQVRFARGDYPEAAERVRSAIRRSPFLAEAYELLGRIRLEAGPLDQAITAMERALALDPLLQTARFELAKAKGLHGDFAKAHELLASIPEADRAGRAPFVMRLTSWSGNTAAWLDVMPVESAPDPSATGALIRYLVATVVSGRVDREVIDRVMAMANQNRPPRFRLLMLQLAAEFGVRAGASEDALHRIESAIDIGLMDLVWLDHCPLLAPLRSDPRFPGLRALVDHRTRPIREILDRP